MFWFIPVSGDGRYLGTNTGRRPAEHRYYREVALAIDTHDSHCPHGSMVGPCTQFMHAASIFAIDVFPVPREPTNR